MKVSQTRWRAGSGWDVPLEDIASDAQLVLAFGGRETLAGTGEPAPMSVLRAAFPQARLVSASTAGEIYGTEVTDDALVVTTVSFREAHITTATASVTNSAESSAAGQHLAAELAATDLRHVLVFAEGLHVNGSQLASGMRSRLPKNVVVTGGLAGDGDKFEKTLVGLDQTPEAGKVVAIGLHGDSLSLGFGSMGGWDSFGPEREITRSSGNVLHELDGEPALELYKRYLGEHAAGLPATGLLFPLAISNTAEDRWLVRTILSVDEGAKSMTFAGDLPQGWQARLMKANFNRLIDGAIGAARTSCDALEGQSAELALLISCVGRKLVLKQRVEEEVEGVREVLGAEAVLSGFYSYGEIAPFMAGVPCELHNQTMTITTITER